MWLLRKLTPDHKTIADFRKDNPHAIKNVCREFTLLCQRMELFSGELVAIDGSKFKAVNSRNSNFNQKKLERAIKGIDDRIEIYLRELDEQDKGESEAQGYSASALQEKIKQLKERKTQYQALEEKLQESGEKQISTTDPDSRLMPTGQKSGDVCYNVQTAVDAKHKLIVAHEVTNAVTDQNQLARMALTAKEMIGVAAMEVVADMGYFDGAEVKECLAAGITPYVAKPDTSANKKRGLFTKDQFAYDRECDRYRCPQGEDLTYRFDAVESGRHIRYYATPKCRDCPVRRQCTRGQERRKGRRITRWIDEHLLEEMVERVRAKPELMKRRKELAEHPFGTMKRGMNQGYFLLRGLKKVRAEMSLTVLSYNVKRVLNILGVEKLIEAVV
jgi:hypothetical protein